MERRHGVVGRRDLLKLMGVGGVGIAATAAGSTLWDQRADARQQPPLTVADAVTTKPQPISPDDALKKLMEGNKRFVEQKPIYPDRSLERLQLVAKAQFPFASILSCSDSRVPSEIVFDQGLGDLFVVRVAGNVATPETIGSIEFGTSVLGSQLLVVMGHKKCGAVTAAVKGDPLPGRIGTFVEDIKPAIARVTSKKGDLVNNVVIANVQYQVEKLKETSSILDKLMDDGKLKIVGAYYDLDTGSVNIVA